MKHCATRGKGAHNMQITRRPLFDNGLWRIGYVAVRNASRAPGNVEYQSEHILVLPLAGVFAKHDGPRRRIVGTPNHAVLIAAEDPYRLSYPDGIGDRCLTVRFSNDAFRQVLQTTEARRGAYPAIFTDRHLLPPQLMLMRNILWYRFHSGQWDPIEVEELGGTLIEATLRLAQDNEQIHRPHLSRQRASIEAVKEAVALRPAHKWRLGDLARLANVSSFHLSHIFRQEVGTSVYDYVLRARLAAVLDVLIDTSTDLTAIGLEAGFSSHSHFTARFHSFFGITPTAFRGVAKTASAAELRRIMTATRDQSC